jgi:selT/selW/selH-like putative selenoprotein
VAAKLKQEFQIEPELIKGGSGVFDVVADGRLIFSKHKAGRFPTPEEIVELLRA